MTTRPRDPRARRWLRWFPWRYVIRQVARNRGLLDPVRILSRLESFAQPLELKEPIELLRAGLVLHARGLMNACAIQHNLDWIWPYWVERQYDPRTESFIPRAFSITHVNLTHRNWTAVGLPDCDALPIVDPRGLLTPFWDGWSLDAWVIGAEGERLVPSRAGDVVQWLELDSEARGPGVRVATCARSDGMELRSRVEVVAQDGVPCCEWVLEAQSASGGQLVVSLRPCNPEGVSFIDAIERAPDGRGWSVGGKSIAFSADPLRSSFSDYRAGDVAERLGRDDPRSSVGCSVGMATAAAEFALEPERPGELRIRIPLDAARAPGADPYVPWQDALAGSARLCVPDARIGELYEAALRTLVLHAPGAVYPGPYTYKRFWFRDAAFMVHALLCAGFERRAERALDRFPAGQTRGGFFHSQEGEWDSNGEVLWIFDRFCRLSGRAPSRAWVDAARLGARWICRTRLPDDLANAHAGLMPAGFSAEHLGPNDFYYWDDFWSVQGLRCAARIVAGAGDRDAARTFEQEASSLLGSVERSLARTASALERPAMPASPYRRLDCGSIGSLAAGYPLQIWAGDDPRLLDTAGWLVEHAFFEGGFFQDIIHSGINPYLTLHVAQVLLRAGDPRCAELLRTVADLASPTGQWPEAIHPRTRGGCMGDGQHAWAAAEWVLYLRNAFVREEEDRLILASGLPPAWLVDGSSLRFGPAPTPFGPIDIEIEAAGGEIELRWKGAWRGAAPRIEVRLLGQAAVSVPPDQCRIALARGPGTPAAAASGRTVP